jgi:hypothetical protein
VETDLIIHCDRCGFISIKVNMHGLFIDEDARDFARKVITEEHASTHQQPDKDASER